VATFSFTLGNLSPRRIAEELDKDGIYAWDGHYYAVEAVKRLGLEDKGGMLRVGAVHYNTAEEIERLGKSLARIAKI
jgi:selenocysteine lyase/cysteine desulfurase